MAGKFMIKETSTGIKFDLTGFDGKNLGSSEVYNSLAACENGIASVKTNASVAEVEDLSEVPRLGLKHPKFEVYQDKSGSFRFRLKAKNGEIILSSRAYDNKDGCMAVVELVKLEAGESPIES